MENKPTRSRRALYLLISTGIGVFVIAVLSLLLSGEGETKVKIATILLDMQDNSIFPYPLTIQNIMTILFALGMGDVIFRYTQAKKESAAVNMKLLPEDDRTVLTVTELPVVRKKINAAQKETSFFLCTLIDECILRFHSNRSIDQTHSVLNSLVDFEMHKIDLRYSMLRYISWVLPTIGFIGTVVGIAAALKLVGASAENLSSGIGPIAGTLGIAFNTTMLALVESAIIVFFIHVVQQKEEESINTSAVYCLRNLINRLYIPEDDKKTRLDA